MPAPEFVVADDGVRIATYSLGVPSEQAPVLLLSGGPGIRSYLEPVAELIAPHRRVHRFDPRGTGHSPWNGEHTIARHVADIVALLDAWGYGRVILAGHSFGSDIACFFLLAHPERVERIVFLSGPFLGDWRGPTHENERMRRTPEQTARLEQLESFGSRSAEEETEFLTLAWMPDHADQQHAEEWARASALALQPINGAMNAQLNIDKRRAPLEDAVPRLRELLSPESSIIGGEEDPRPARFLVALAAELGCPVTIIDEAGHEPWRERPVEFGDALTVALG